jgi:predicted AlkP superfamily pyrophosphatase or phosphodiesterase
MSFSIPPRLFAAVSFVFASICLASSNASAESAKPRLVVVVSIDQFPYEYLSRMRKGFAEDGFFNTVSRAGATFTECHHAHAFTITGPGHSVLCSGAFPGTTGIIDNDWFDRTAGKTMYCVSDPSVRVVGAAGDKAMSPKNLEIGTVGDQIKLATNGRGKVLGVALKDRASILMTGHMADAAYWHDADAHAWVTSTYYRPALPDYLRAYNDNNLGAAYGGQDWNLLLDEKLYDLYYPDNAPFETNVAGIGRSFPRTLPAGDKKDYWKAMTTSPYGSAMTLAVARLVLTEEKLGQDDDVDMLCINLSSNDYIGHAFGPYSLEVQDMTYRTDRMLGEFVRFLDEAVGKDHWTLALSSDHGVAPVPEHAVQMRLPGRRVPSEHFETLRKNLEESLVKQLGTPADGKKYIRHLDSNMAYLDVDLPELQGPRFSEAQRHVRDALLKDDAIYCAYTRDELTAGGNEMELFTRSRLSFHQRRSGDVLFCMKPYYIAGKTTATHGSPWTYDTHVPLLWLGAGIRPGFYNSNVSPAHLGPTMARLIGVEAPSGATVEARMELLK